MEPKVALGFSNDLVVVVVVLETHNSPWAATPTDDTSSVHLLLTTDTDGLSDGGAHAHAHAHRAHPLELRLTARPD